MDLRELNRVNVRRCEESFHKVNDWSPCDWMTAVAGEVGEAANKIKKLKRIETDGLDTPQNRELLELIPRQLLKEAPDVIERAVREALQLSIADELADVVIYLDLLAHRLGVSLSEAVVRKFNRTSEKVGSPLRLPDAVKLDLEGQRLGHFS